jgi:hypothetical protein
LAASGGRGDERQEADMTTKDTVYKYSIPAPAPVFCCWD